MERDIWSLILRGAVTTELEALITPETVNKLIPNLEWTPLTLAIIQSITLMTWLLSKGANPSNHRGENIIVLFARHRHGASRELIRHGIHALVAAGADVNCVGKANVYSWDAAVVLIECDGHFSDIRHPYLMEIVNARNCCRAMARLIIGLGKHRSSVLNTVDRHVVQLIARQVYSTRGDDAWFLVSP